MNHGDSLWPCPTGSPSRYLLSENCQENFLYEESSLLVVRAVHDVQCPMSVCLDPEAVLCDPWPLDGCRALPQGYMWLPCSENMLPEPLRYSEAKTGDLNLGSER